MKLKTGFKRIIDPGGSIKTPCSETNTGFSDSSPLHEDKVCSLTSRATHTPHSIISSCGPKTLILLKQCQAWHQIRGEGEKEREEASVLLETGRVCTGGGATKRARSCAEGATWTRASSEWPASGSSG